MGCIKSVWCLWHQAGSHSEYSDLKTVFDTLIRQANVFRCSVIIYLYSFMTCRLKRVTDCSMQFSVSTVASFGLSSSTYFLHVLWVLFPEAFINAPSNQWTLEQQWKYVSCNKEHIREDHCFNSFNKFQYLFLA